MNPYKLKNVFEYLTSNNQLLKRKLKLGTRDITITPKRKYVIDIEAINRFNKDNPRVDTTNIQPVVKQSTIKQSNVGEIDEGVIQGAFDTATMEARDGGYPAPVYEAFKKRYLKRNMKADGGRIGYNEGSKLTDFLDVQASGTKSGKQQIQGAPEGITSDKETLNAIVRLDVPISEKINLIGDLQYGKFRDRIEYKDNEIFLDDPKSYRDRNIGLDYNRGGEGFSGSATVGDEGPAFNIRYKKSFADGGMLVKPSDDGSRPGYAKSKGKGIQLTAKEQKLLKDNLSTEDFNKLDFDRTGLQSGQKNYGVGRNDDSVLLRKVRNILNPGQDSVGVKILNNKNWTDTVIKLTNQGKSPLDITNVLSKKDSKITRNVVSSAINSLIDRNQLNKKYYVMPSSGLIKGDFDKKLKIVEKLVNKGDLGRADIGREAGVSDSVVEKWIRTNKGDEFYETNFTYEKGVLKKGNLQKQKDLFNLVESKGSISASEISKLFKMNKAESKKLMADLVGTIYRMSGDSKSNSLVVPYDDSERMKSVLNTIRTAPDFEDIYQRRIETLVREAFPKGSKAQKQAIQSLKDYRKFSFQLKEMAPELALALDHIVPYQFLDEVAQGANPINLIRVKPITGAVNRFKSNFDKVRIDLNRALKIDPNNKQLLQKFKLLKELEELTPVEFGGVSKNGTVYNFKQKPIGQSDLIADAKLAIQNYDDVGTFSQQVLKDPNLQAKFIKSGISNKDLGMFKNIKPIEEKKLKNLIASFGGGTCSVFSGKKATLKADGGRIGLATGTPDIDKCYDAATAAINSGKVPVDKADDFAQLLKRTAGLGRNIMKYGIIPEALYATADSLVRVGMGDTFTEAGLRATDYLLPGDQTKTAEISKVSRIFGDETGELVGRTIDYKKQLEKIQNLEDQKANFENLSDGGEFSYIGDLSSDVNNIDTQLTQARNDLDNKFKISEAEQLFAESKQDDAYDASKATSFLSNLKRKYRDSSDNLSDVETLAAPEKTQMQLNLNMLPTAPREYMTATDDQIRRFVEQENATGSNLNVKKYIDFRDQLKDDFMTKGPGVYGKEQVYGANATFGGEPVDMTNYFGPANSQTSNRFGSQQRPVLYPEGRGQLAGGGIAKMAGDRSGPPPESGPNPQGLLSLMKRARNY